MKKALFLFFVVGITISLSAADPIGIKPVGKDGKPLNLDFEDGTLKDWVATGDAFDKQPIKGDLVSKRRSDMKSGHRGEYWIGGVGNGGEKAKRTLTSVPVKGRDTFARFLLGGGADAGSGGEQAVKEMTLPEGFSATVFAAEPDITQPIAMCIDARGRLWVVEAHSYPKKQPEGQGKDRIIIFEDTDGDGKADKRTVFMEGLNLVSGIEVRFGGVFVGAAPQMLFIPDKDGDDKPDGPPQVLLDGFGMEDTHETLNAFIWGPDGWLYGCHGVFTFSKVGKPGTPAEQRIPINAGISRYHPQKQIFEVFAEGTSNPSGGDVNYELQAVCTACVIPHQFHLIQAARYTRHASQHYNPYIYKDIKTIADHVHYAGTAGPHAGNNRSDAAGGGHAHCGAMIYLGDSWPAQYRNTILMSNIHGNRINNDLLDLH